MPRIPDPLPGWKTATGLVTLLTMAALLYFGKVSFEQFLLVAGPGLGVAAWGAAAKVQRARP